MNNNFKKGTLITTLALSMTLASFSCKTDSKQNTTAVVPTSSNGKAITIAYVTMDSILKNYQYAIDIRTKLESDSKDAQAQMQSKVNAFQTAAQDFQRKVKINAFVNQDAAKAAQDKLIKQQQEVQQMEAELQQTLAQKQLLMNQDMYKNIEDKIKEFNKDGKYTLILTSSGLNNILYADKNMDITEPFLKYLNDNYNKDTNKVAKDSVK